MLMGAQMSERVCRPVPQVLMVVFDLMASAQRMAAWLEGALDGHMLALATLRGARRACHLRISQAHAPRRRLHSNELPGGSGALPAAAVEGLQQEDGSGAMVRQLPRPAACL